MVFGGLLRLALTFAYLFGVMALYAVFGPFGIFDDAPLVILAASVVGTAVMVAAVRRAVSPRRE